MFKTWKKSEVKMEEDLESVDRGENIGGWKFNRWWKFSKQKLSTDDQLVFWVLGKNQMTSTLTIP